MSATRAVVRTICIAGFKAEISVPRLARGSVSSAIVEWSPRVPRFDKDFTKAERETYQRSLTAAVAAAFEQHQEFRP